MEKNATKKQLFETMYFHLLGTMPRMTVSEFNPLFISKLFKNTENLETDKRDCVDPKSHFYN